MNIQTLLARQKLVLYLAPKRVFLLTLIFAVLIACQSQRPTSTPSSVQSNQANSACQTIDHVWGKTEFCGIPQRVIALDPHALDLLLSLDIQPIGYAEDSRALVGSPGFGESVIDVKYLGAYLSQKPTHVGTWQTPSLETMLRLQPDLILGGYLDRSQYQTFSKLAPTLLPIEDWAFHNQWQTNLLTLSKVFRREAQAQHVIDNYRQRVQAVKASVGALSDRSLLLLSMSSLDSISVFNQETFAGGILQELGFELVLPKASANYGEIDISLEMLPELNANTIIVMVSEDSTIDQVKEMWQQNSVLRTLEANQSGHVYFVDYQLWSRIQGAIAAQLVIDQIQTLLLQ